MVGSVHLGAPASPQQKRPIDSQPWNEHPGRDHLRQGKPPQQWRERRINRQEHRRLCNQKVSPAWWPSSSQLTAIWETTRRARAIGVPIIADGGVRASGDIAKALAVGADSVMIGSMFAGTKEAPGEVEQTERGLFKRVWGMASKEAAQLRAERAGEELDDEYFEQRAPEGVEGTVPYRGEASKLIWSMMAGLRSSMSYSNATTIEEFQRVAEFVRVTPLGLRENTPHATTGA